MRIILDHLHQETKSFKIISFGSEFELMPLEKWNDNFKKIASVVNLVSVAILMVRPRILLEVHATATKEFFQSIEDVLIFLDKLDIELRLHGCSPCRLLFYIDISDIYSEASFTIYETYDVIWCKTIHFE